MNILVIDGQGGQLGGQLIKSIKENLENITIMAVGTNATATATMLKAGADQAATGENPVVVACRKADVIIGPILRSFTLGMPPMFPVAFCMVIVLGKIVKVSE